jgi:hypothetical protein
MDIVCLNLSGETGEPSRRSFAIGLERAAGVKELSTFSFPERSFLCGVERFKFSSGNEGQGFSEFF